MSQENVELARRSFDAFNRRDLSAFLALCHPDVEFVTYAMQLEGGDPYRGHEGVRAWWESLFAVYPDFRAEIEDIQDLGDLIITRARMHGRGVESAAPMDQQVWQVARARDGKAIGWRWFSSEADALEAAGLRELAMSSENPSQDGRKLLEATLDALNARDFAALSELVGPALEFRSVLGGTEGEVYAGIDGMRTWAEQVDAVWDHWHQELVDYRELGEDQAVAIIRATGVSRASGVPLDTCTGNVFTRRHGKWRTEAYTDPREALEAVGLRE